MIAPTRAHTTFAHAVNDVHRVRSVCNAMASTPLSKINTAVCFSTLRRRFQNKWAVWGLDAIVAMSLFARGQFLLARSTPYIAVRREREITLWTASTGILNAIHRDPRCKHSGVWLTGQAPVEEIHSRRRPRESSGAGWGSPEVSFYQNLQGFYGEFDHLTTTM